MSLLGMDEQTSGPQPWDQLRQAVTEPPNSMETEGPYSRTNEQALAINQRSPRSWTGHTALASCENPSRLLNAQPGRKSFTITVPSEAPYGVYIDMTAATLALDPPLGFFIPVGGAITVATEGGCYVRSASATEDTTVCLLTTWG